MTSPRGPAAPGSASIPIWMMATGGFAAGSGMRVLDPLLPMVAHDLGTTVAGASGLVAGFALAYGLGQVVTGPLGDRFGKPRIACLALFLYGALLMVSAMAGTLGTLIALRGAAGLAAGAIIPLLMAHIGDSVPYAERQATIGRFLTGMVMAQLVAGPVSGVVGEAAGWQASFLVLGALTVSVGALMGARLGRVLIFGGGATGGRGLGLSGFIDLLRHRAGRRLMLAAALDGLLLFGGAFPFIGAYLVQEFSLTAAEAGLAVAGFGVGSFVYTRLARRLVARFGEKGLVLLGGFGLAIGLMAVAVAPGWWLVVAAQMLMGLVFFMFHGVLQARATEALPEARGTAVAFFAMSLFLGQSVGSLAFGLAIAALGFRPGFAIAGVAIVALALWTCFVLLRMPAAPAPKEGGPGG